MAIHVFESTADAYNATQCDPEVKKGDLLYIPSEQVIGIADTWPIAITEKHGELHCTRDIGQGGDEGLLMFIEQLASA